MTGASGAREPVSPARPTSACVACGSPGDTAYEGLTDRLYGSPGSWRMVRCSGPACGLLWLDPPPDEQALALAYRGYHTHAPPPDRAPWARLLRRWLKEGYYASRFGYTVRGARVKRFLALALLPFPALRAGLDGLIMHLPPRPGGRLLDVGCGNGLAIGQLKDLGWDAEGVDSDPAAVAAASSRGLTVREGSLPQQHYADASFDVVTMNHVLEHVPDPAGLLAECRRVLQPDGRLVVVTPNAASLGHARFGAAWRGLEPPRHLQVFTAPALERLLAAARLQRTVLRTSAGAAAFLHAESRRIGGAADASPKDAAARRFAQEEAERIAGEPWIGEELVLVATPHGTADVPGPGAAQEPGPRVGIVLLNWNGYADTRRCLESLATASYPHRTTYLADNGSTDGSMDRLEGEFAQSGIVFIRNGENLGFSAGCNRAIRRALDDGCDYVLLLNNDCIVTQPGFLEPMVALAESDPRVGLVGGKLLRWPPSNVIWETGGWIHWAGERYVGMNEPDLGQHGSVAARGFISGALMLIRRECLERVGLLPEAYFFGHEDWEYGARVRRLGYRLLYQPRAVVHHEAEHSHEPADPYYLFNDILSKILFKKRNAPARSVPGLAVAFATFTSAW